jgi:phosphoribosyl 1,2-cyclic phosphate phosphodiesterase
MDNHTHRIEFLGTGTSQGIPVIGCHCSVCTDGNPKNKRLRSSVLIETPSQTILIDAGPDLRTQLLRCSLPLPVALLITHAHQDHTAGLDDLRPLIHHNRKPFPVYCETSVEKRLRQQYAYAFEDNPYPGAPQFEINPISDHSFSIGEDTIIPIRAFHGDIPVLGFRIGDISYLTDIKTIDKSELKKLRGTQILVLNALRHKKHHSHLTVQEAVELAEGINAPLTYFTHISHNLGAHDKEEAKLPEGIHLSTDLLVAGCSTRS